MKKEHRIWALKELMLARMDLSEDKISSAKERLGTVYFFLEQQFDIKDDMDKLQFGIPVCICNDELGWSTCGGECPVHRPYYNCICGGCGNCTLIGTYQGCSKKVAYMKICRRCGVHP